MYVWLKKRDRERQHMTHIVCIDESRSIYSSEKQEETSSKRKPWHISQWLVSNLIRRFGSFSERASVNIGN
jgi:hypothetical protein